jgi:hypothetical protein
VAGLEPHRLDGQIEAGDERPDVAHAYVCVARDAWPLRRACARGRVRRRICVRVRRLLR